MNTRLASLYSDAKSELAPSPTVLSRLQRDVCTVIRVPAQTAADNRQTDAHSST
jgi:hypothetical protein